MEGSQSRNGSETDKHVLSSGRIAIAADRVAVPVAPPRPAEPKVEVIRNGETIEAIEVSCCCGRKIRLRCIE